MSDSDSFYNGLSLFLQLYKCQLLFSRPFSFNLLEIFLYK